MKSVTPSLKADVINGRPLMSLLLTRCQSRQSIQFEIIPTDHNVTGSALRFILRMWNINKNVRSNITLNALRYIMYLILSHAYLYTLNKRIGTG